MSCVCPSWFITSPPPIKPQAVTNTVSSRYTAAVWLNRSAGVIINPAVAIKERLCDVKWALKSNDQHTSSEKCGAIFKLPALTLLESSTKPWIIMHSVSLAVLLAAKWLNPLDRTCPSSWPPFDSDLQSCATEDSQALPAHVLLCSAVH